MEASTVEVHGQWREVEDPLVDATYLELAEYCKFRRLMTAYIEFVRGVDKRPLPEAVKTALDALRDMIYVFPLEIQVLRRPTRGKGVFSYQTAYLVFSERQPFTRSAMLARLPAVVAKMEGLKARFKRALTEPRWVYFEDLYAQVLAAYGTWRATATAKVQVPFTHLRKGEEGVRKRAAVGLEELLRELKMLAGITPAARSSRGWP